MKNKIFISTGGSGGHVIPAITIFDHLKSNYDILISTDLRGLQYIDKENYKPITINTPKLNNLFLLPFALSKVLFLTFKCLIILKKKKISILVSTGGYMSLPLCLAAKVLRIKIFLIEPNMVLGRANRFFLNFSEKLLSYSKNLINFPKGMEQKQIIIRPLIRKKYYEIIINISNKHSIKLIHQTSEKNIIYLKNFYKENKIENKVFNFDQNLNKFLRQSDLCITRAGASSLAELSLYHIPFIAIPLPASKDNHQYENAKYYQDKDCCWIINQNDFDKQKFEELLIKISVKEDEYFTKKNNLKKLNYQNTWKNVNQKLLEIFNEY